MMEVTGNMSSARVNAPAELPSPENRSIAQQAPVAQGRQPESIPGVSVQISAAAREAAARDELSASPESTTATRATTEAAATSAANAAGGSGANQAASRLDAPESPDRAASGDGSSNSQSAQVRQAVQMFTDTAGIGVSQQNDSPLRTSA